MECPSPKEIEKEIFSANRQRAKRMLANLIDAETFAYCASDGADCVPTIVVLDYSEDIVRRPGRAFWHLWVKVKVTCVPRQKSSWEIVADAVIKASLIVIATIGVILAAPIIVSLAPAVESDPAKAEQAARFVRELVRSAR